MKCVILQPSYIPWRGYFHLIQKSDVFIFYDTVQYDKHGWRNRNRIKTPAGSQWLTIPVQSKGNIGHGLTIRDAKMAPWPTWARKHLASIRQNYARAPFFKKYEPVLERMFQTPTESLSDFTIQTTLDLARELGIAQTKFFRSSELGVEGHQTDALVDLLKKVNATHYISGPSAREYLEESKLTAAGISLEWMEYAYAEYPQLHPPFDPHVTVLDLLFMTGPEAGKHIWGPA